MSEEEVDSAYLEEEVAKIIGQTDYGYRGDDETYHIAAKQIIDLVWATRGKDMNGTSCEDCGLLYSNFGLDLTLSDEDWERITTDSDREGILCASCIVRRASRLPDVVAVRAWLDDGTKSVARIGKTMIRPEFSIDLEYWE